MKINRVIILFTCVVLSFFLIVPPRISTGQKERIMLKEKVDNLKERTENLDEKLNSVVEVPKEPKVVYRTRFRTKVVNRDRRVIIKHKELYFEVQPSVDESGNYVIDLELVNKEKDRCMKEIGLKKPWYKRIF